MDSYFFLYCNPTILTRSDISLFGDLLDIGFPHVQQLPLQRVDSIVVLAHHANPGHGQSLGRVPLSENQGTPRTILGSSLVGVVQLRDSSKLGSFLPLLRLAQLVLRPELAPHQHRLDDPRLGHILLELVGKFALRAKALSYQSHRLLGLRVKSGIFYEAAHENPHVIFDLLGRYLHPSLVLLVDALYQRLDHHVCHMVDMLATLQGSDAVDEANLLKSLVGDADGYFPPGAASLLVDLERVPRLVLLVLGEETNIVFEGVDREFLAIEVDLDSSRRRGDIEGSSTQDGHHVGVQLLHSELGKVWLERHLGELLPRRVLHLGI